MVITFPLSLEYTNIQVQPPMPSCLLHPPWLEQPLLGNSHQTSPIQKEKECGKEMSSYYQSYNGVKRRREEVFRCPKQELLSVILQKYQSI